ncbi:hypothetical protein NE236_16105 [Actinoallomurus purpureus]|uniref:hypothetical protein n=1 Tax=Actinoallomurus purpureus TaxID=478114 RepID=UPI002092CE43|nr:hypothetical protein [Actinoallomurus purpureus]MCO6006510.1 hypothetical protein [Actinoallomurus purpureus]
MHDDLRLMNPDLGRPSVTSLSVTVAGMHFMVIRACCVTRKGDLGFAASPQGVEDRAGTIPSSGRAAYGSRMRPSRAVLIDVILTIGEVIGLCITVSVAREPRSRPVDLGA